MKERVSGGLNRLLERNRRDQRIAYFDGFDVLAKRLLVQLKQLALLLQASDLLPERSIAALRASLGLLLLDQRVKLASIARVTLRRLLQIGVAEQPEAQEAIEIERIPQRGRVEALQRRGEGLGCDVAEGRERRRTREEDFDVADRAEQREAVSDIEVIIGEQTLRRGHNAGELLDIGGLLIEKEQQVCENVGVAIEQRAEHVQIAAVEFVGQFVDLSRVEEEKTLQDLRSKQNVEKELPAGVWRLFLAERNHLRENSRGGEGVDHVHRDGGADRVARRRDLRNQPKQTSRTLQRVLIKLLTISIGLVSPSTSFFWMQFIRTVRSACSR